MNKWLIPFAVFLAASASADAADIRKTFTMTVHPADAVIRVVSGSSLKEQQYRSPAKITAFVPEDRDLAQKAVVEITRDRHKQVIIPLRNIRDGEVLKLQLQKDGRKALTFRMIAPKESNDIRIRDENVDLGLVLDQRQMQMSLTNLTAQPIHVLWQRAIYTDTGNNRRRIMHPGIRYEDRNRSFPYQTIMPYMTVHQAIIPVDDVKTGLRKKVLETEPLFPGEALERMHGKKVGLQIPIQIADSVVKYNFRVKILVD